MSSPKSHSLPKEILEMGEADTACQYCGVSYLVHRESKMLKVACLLRSSRNNIKNHTNKHKYATQDAKRANTHCIISRWTSAAWPLFVEGSVQIRKSLLVLSYII